MQRTLDENSTKDPALFYTVFTSDGEIVASNCPYFDLREEMKLLEVGQGSKKLYGINRRYQRIQKDALHISMVSNSTDLERSANVFRLHTNVCVSLVKDIAAIRTDILESALHDLPDLHGKNIQQIFQLISDDDLKGTPTEQRDRLTKIFAARPEEVRSGVLNLIRNNKIISSHFKLIRLLNDQQHIASFGHESIHPIIQGLLYIHYGLFEEDEIQITHSECYEGVNIDYELFVGGLMPIFHNLYKYAARPSKIYIDYFLEESNLKVQMRTKSLGVEPGEEDLIFRKGYSGMRAVSMGRQGNGLGMYHARKLLNATNVAVHFEPGRLSSESEYADNRIILTFPRL